MGPTSGQFLILAGMHSIMFCLHCFQDYIPLDVDEKRKLRWAHLMDKKIVFANNSDPIEFRETLFSVFPVLKNTGFELMRSRPPSRVHLKLIPPPPDGYTSQFLADFPDLGQAVCYVRPVQHNIDLDVHQRTRTGDRKVGMHAAIEKKVRN